MSEKKASGGTRRKEPGSDSSETLENIIAVAVILLLILAVYALFTGRFTGWLAKSDDKINGEERYPVTIDDDPMLGNPKAPVTIIQFSDYYSSACKEWQQNSFPKLKERYLDTGKARFVYRDYPLEELHPGATNLAAAVSCAAEQGKFWELHNAIYDLDEVTEELLNETAAKLGINTTLLDECRARGEYQEEALRDRREGLAKGGVTATPTFFINQLRVIGNNWDALERVIKEELSGENTG